MAKLVRKKKIIVPRNKISVLMSRFDCAQSMVYNALAYRSKSDMAEKIRKMALIEYGGRNVSVPVYEQ